MESPFSGKIALVTGASQGIGKAVAIGLAKEGAKVAICSRRESVLAETARNIESTTGSQVIPFAADISRSADVKALVKQVIEKFGAIHILVNCAAVSTFGRFLDLSDETWKSILETKFFGYMYCIREVIPNMINQKYGRIVNISGGSGKEPKSLNHLPGACANAAIDVLTKGLAREMGKYNIRINVVVPGGVDTERHIKLMEADAVDQQSTLEAVKNERLAQMPLGREAQTEEIANAVLFLVSDKSSYITGARLRVDGGRSMSV